MERNKTDGSVTNLHFFVTAFVTVFVTAFPLSFLSDYHFVIFLFKFSVTKLQKFPVKN